MKKILIAIDYSPSAQKVAEQGYTLGKAMKAEIVLLHIIENIDYYSSTVYDPIMGFGGFVNSNILSADIIQNIEKEAGVFLESIKIHLDDKDIRTMVVHGNISEDILEISKKQKFDLVVIGTHSRNGIEGLLLGSTAQNLLKHSSIPMLIIPTKKTNE